MAPAVVAALSVGVPWVILGFGLLANALALVVFLRRSRLRTLSNRFVINLLVSNLVACACILISSALGPLDPESIGSRAAFNFLAASSTLAVLLIAVDQYLGVVHSLTYHARTSTARTIGLLAGGWMVSLAAAATAAATPSAPVALQVASFTLVQLAPSIGLAWLYAKIYAAARSSGRRARRHVGSAGPLIPTQPTINHFHIAPHGLVTYIKIKISSINLFRRRREESRAARIAICVVAVCIVCYLPHATYGLVRGIGLAPDHLWPLGIIRSLLATSTLATPAVFAYRNRRVRKEIASMLGDKKHMKKLRYLEPLSVRPQKQCVCLKSGPQRCFLPHSHGFIIQKCDPSRLEESTIVERVSS